MNFGYAWIVGIGTVFSLGLVVMGVYFLRYYRKRLLPPRGGRDRGEALAELHLLQAEMRNKLEEREVPEPVSSEDPVERPPDRSSTPGTGPQDEESRQDALAQLQALQAKMRARLEEDQARERAEGRSPGPSDTEFEDPDPEV